ncbi:MAG: ABC transporter ATP-binding protein [Lachnospiraceae bacterium]|nr:ABC transporter ATP-binding protein [Lachnospiraceae bacterium]
MNNIFDILELVINVTSVVFIIMTQVWWVGLTVLIAAIPLMIVAIKSGKKTYQSVRDTRKYFRRSNYYHEVLTQREFVEERSLFGYCNSINKKWFDLYEKHRKNNLKVTIETAIKTRLSAFSTLAVSAVVVIVLILLTVNGKMSIGLFTGLTTTALTLVDTMSWFLAYVARTFAEKQEYLKDLTKFMALSEQDGSLDLPQSNGLKFDTVEFKNVSFKYPDTDKYILKDLNLILKKNVHYAFVGVNGAGKTTITKLLTGMYDNYEGDILINGKNLREYSLSQLKGLFTVVYQDFAKFQITVGDNIMVGNVHKLEKRHNLLTKVGLTDTSSEKIMKTHNIDKYKYKEIEDILDEIDLLSSIENLPKGLDTNLGKITKNSVDISGGQWQRIAVARTLFNPALVRILDEPTAALDPVAESNIYKMFGRISTGKTTIFITHRLGAAKLADEIIVINDGKVAEKGNHNKLVQLGGIYASMFDSQKSWYQTDEGGVNNES